MAEHLNGIASITDSVERALEGVIDRHGLTEAKAPVVESEDYTMSVRIIAEVMAETATDLGIGPEGVEPEPKPVAEADDDGGGEPVADAEGAEDGDGGEGAETKDDDATNQRPLTVVEAIRRLTPGEPAHWNKSGLPDANVLTEMMGQKVSSKAVKKAWATIPAEEQAALRG